FRFLSRSHCSCAVLRCIRIRRHRSASVSGKRPIAAIAFGHQEEKSARPGLRFGGRGEQSGGDATALLVLPAVKLGAPAPALWASPLCAPGLATRTTNAVERV